MAEAEIDQSDVPMGVQKHILRFDVAVDDQLRFVQILERGDQLAEKATCVKLRKSFVLVDIRKEGPVFDVFLDEMHGIGRLNDLIEPANKRVIHLFHK
jgi:hypothetical protein